MERLPTLEQPLNITSATVESAIINGEEMELTITPESIASLHIHTPNDDASVARQLATFLGLYNGTINETFIEVGIIVVSLDGTNMNKRRFALNYRGDENEYLIDSTSSSPSEWGGVWLEND
jgi:hypothetical protein